MSNTRHTNGHVPPALGGPPEPPSLAELIGHATALHLAPLLAQAVAAGRDACFFCVLDAKRLIHDHHIACMNAAQANEPTPALPPPPQVAQSVTQVIVSQLVPGPAGTMTVTATVPACWEHVQLPQAPPRQTGLVTADGRPVIAGA